MADFNLAYQNTMIAEGGYVNDPKDRGGETYMGISRANFPHWLGWPVIDSYIKNDLSGELLNAALKDNHSLQLQVRSFYKDQFWHPMFDQLDQDVANEIFDTGVNQGKSLGVRYFQAALNILNRNQADYPNAPTDGSMGAITLACYHSLIATQKYPSRSYNKIVKALLKLMNYFQMTRYADIVERDEDQERFIFGWTERIM